MTCNSCDTRQCLWSGKDEFCKILKRGGVPLDGKWPFLILQMRSIHHNRLLSEVQKNSVQKLLIETIQKKDFSKSMYNEVSDKMHSIVLLTCEKRIEEIEKEAIALTHDVEKILGKHKQSVVSAAQEIDDGVAQGRDVTSILSGLRKALGTIIAKMEEDANVLMILSHKDSLTGLANRRSFDAYMDETIAQWQKTGQDAALILFDIDHFKAFNDTYGHLVGDQVLRTLAVQMKKIADSLGAQTGQCLVARYGGEEFVFVLRGDLVKEAATIASYAREVVASTPLLLRGPDGSAAVNGARVTVSLGISPLWSGWDGAYQENMIDCADKALYYAKNNGRNCVAIYHPESGTVQLVPTGAAPTGTAPKKIGNARTK